MQDSRDLLEKLLQSYKGSLWEVQTGIHRVGDIKVKENDGAGSEIPCEEVCSELEGSHSMLQLLVDIDQCLQKVWLYDNREELLEIVKIALQGYFQEEWLDDLPESIAIRLRMLFAGNDSVWLLDDNFDWLPMEVHHILQQTKLHECLVDQRPHYITNNPQLLEMFQGRLHQWQRTVKAFQNLHEKLDIMHLEWTLFIRVSRILIMADASQLISCCIFVYQLGRVRRCT